MPCEGVVVTGSCASRDGELGGSLRDRHSEDQRRADEIRAEKATLRLAALARRDAFALEARMAASKSFAMRGPAALGDVGGALVSGFWPIRSELDPRWLMRELAAKGARLALPCIEYGRLVFRQFTFGEPLRKVGFGLSQPFAEATLVDPEVMLVPLAAFDRDCGRIGYGKGYYDGAIERLAGKAKPPRTLGLAFACQEVEKVPLEPHDQRLEGVLTERELIRPR
ncbi:MAG: 5-formyltetrahydrofolate cyclo-ligase [Hyphomicrobiales bacterium]|nr:5-formyltetrahydrofolate cyclo-ligase [Hyphomicrobiales bacterium]